MKHIIIRILNIEGILGYIAVPFVGVLALTAMRIAHLWS